MYKTTPSYCMQGMTSSALKRASLGVGFTVAFIVLTTAVLHGATLTTDQLILLRLHARASPDLDRLAILFTALGGLGGMIPPALLSAWSLFRRRKHSAAFGIICCVGGAYLLSVLCKLVVHRERPHLWAVLTPESDFSYPSGHALLSLSTVIAMVWVVWHTPYRLPALVLGGLFVVLVGLSRLYLGVHYPSDVLAGWLASGLWCTAVAWGVTTLEEKE